MSGRKEFWFSAKRYGWGWGLPRTWQGWAVLGAFVLFLVFGSVLFPPAEKPWFFGIYTAVLCLLLLAICYAKGERPRWRWGADK
jgi:hypothetical protein